LIAAPAGLRVGWQRSRSTFGGHQRAGRSGGADIEADPYGGEIFVFRSKRADRIKLLAWDGTGIILATKWLEQGRFAWPPIADGAMCLSPTQLALLLDGLSWSQAIAPIVKKPVLPRDLTNSPRRGECFDTIPGMPLRREDLPADPDQLAALALELAEENERLRAALHSINTLHFGASSERLVTLVEGQMALSLGDLGTDARPLPHAANDDRATKPKARVPGKPARRNHGALPKHLPRFEEIIEPPSTTCPCCDRQMHRIGACIHEALDVVPAILRVLRTVRPKYACRGCESIVAQAPAPSRLINAGMASTALVAWVVVSKFSSICRSTGRRRCWLATASRWTVDVGTGSIALPGGWAGCMIACCAPSIARISSAMKHRCQ
jgi:transposase